MTDMKKAAGYLELDYPVLVTRDPETKAFILEIPDWPGCVADGDSLEAAFRKLRDAQVTWVEDSIERGLDIPLPRPNEDFSGKFLLRLPRSLHRRLSELARQDDISLNAFVSTVLAEHIGSSKGERRLRSATAELTACLSELRQQVKNKTSPVLSGTRLHGFESYYLPITQLTLTETRLFSPPQEEDAIRISDIKRRGSLDWLVEVK
jgi:predicted RNase H-like HicB family nuclease